MVWGIGDLCIKLPLFFGLALLIFNCLGVSVAIFGMSKWKVKTSMLHPDGSGGLRPIGELALKNVASWAIPMTSLIVAISILYIYNTPGFGFAIPLLIAFSALIAISTVLIFIVPLWSVHGECIQNKKDKLESVQKPFDDYYKEFREKLGEREDLKKKFRGTEVDLKKELEEFHIDSELIEKLLLLNTLNEQIEELRDWPWDTGILWKAFLAILFPIIMQLVIQGINLLT